MLKETQFEMQTSYEGGGPCRSPVDDEEVCNWRSEEDCDSSREVGGVSLPPLSKDTPSVEEVRP